MPDGVTREEFAELGALVRGLSSQLLELRPLLLERSGNERRLAEIERDLTASHDKHRAHFAATAELRDELRSRLTEERDAARLQRETIRSESAERLRVLDERMDRVEDRQKRVLYGLAALAAVIELLARGGAAVEFVRGLF